MRLPIQYAFTYPERVLRKENGCDLVAEGPLTFETVRDDMFPVLGMAYRAGIRGGTTPAAFNAANEEAARGFLEEKISFNRIPEIIEQMVTEHPFSDVPVWEEGKTTAADVAKFLGPPSQLIPLHDETVFYYMREGKEGNALMLIVWNSGTQVSSYDRAIFFFDGDGVLKTYSYSNDTLPYKPNKNS